MTAAEDWHGRYWSYRPGCYTRMCNDTECLDPVAVERRGFEWWWSHGDAGGGPFVHWQEAAQYAVESGAFDRPSRPPVRFGEPTP